MIRSFLIGAFSAGALMAFVPAASAMTVDSSAAQGVSEAGVTKVAVVCNRWGRNCRRVYAPRVYAPRVVIAPPVYVAPRRAYVRPGWGSRCGWRNGHRVCW